jgi:carboxypeptidase family protein
MRIATRSVLVAAWFAACPALALAQTSSIAGVVKDPSGALLPGVTVEAASPSLIEKVRTGTTDGAGQYKIINLVPGTYSVTFTLPGFNTVKRDGIELTSDFTATITVEMKVGAVEETITVVAESPVVDTQNITTRQVMTREVLDSIPTGRNIQAIGIMIPGTSLALGGGGALSRDVGGSGSLQQSPLQFRGSADTVQTIDGMRLNNLCANGAYSGVYWNDGSFQEISYVTGADSAEMGQGGMRVNMVPKDGGNRFHGVVFGNYAPSSWASDNCKSPGIGQPCTRKELSGDRTYNPNNRLTNVPKLQKIYDFNPSVGGPIARNRLWFYATYRYWGLEKTVTDSFFDADPSPFRYVADTSRPGVDDGHIRSVAGRVSWQIGGMDKVSYYHDDQNKVRGHWGIASTIPPEASAIQETPTSFVSVSKWTRTQTNRLLFDAGFAVYNQQYNEIYQPSVFEGPVPLVTIFDSQSGKFANAWNNPAEHYSKLFTEQFAANYVTGSHSMRIGATISQAKWRLVRRRTGDVERVTFNNGNPSSVTLSIPTDRRNEISTDAGVFAQDKWTFRRATVNAGLRWDYFAAGSAESSLQASAFNDARTFSKCSDGRNNLAEGCTGRVTNWKDINPRVGVSFDLFGNGRTAVKGSVARYVAGIGLAGIVDDNNPANTVGLTDTRNWTDRDANGSPFDAAGNLQFGELAASTNTNFGRNIPSTTTTDPGVLTGWGKRGYNWEYAVGIQHEIMPRMAVSGGWYRRKFGNQTITVDQRFSIEKGSYDGPFCVNAPANPNLPDNGNYQVCGLYDLKPSVAANPGPANSLLTFSEKYGGETNIYEGFEVSMNARPKAGMFVQAGINAQKRRFNECALVEYGVLSRLTGATTTSSEIFPDGRRACQQNLPYRPDFKLFGSYTLPFDIQFSGTYQFVRGLQTGGAAPSLLATWAAPASATTLGRSYANNATTRTFNLIPVGENYGNFNLNQLDLRASKRFRLGQARLRFDADVYNIFNSNWPFTASSTFSTSATTATWQRPTNVLQARFFKVGLNFDF